MAKTRLTAGQKLLPGSSRRPGLAAPFNRRTLLRGAGVLLGLPFLESLSGTTHAGTPPIPKRLIIVYQTAGLVKDQWNPVPVAGDPGHDFGPIMSPLKAYLDDIVVMTGIDNATAVAEGGNAHNAAAGHSLTGKMMQPGGKDLDYTLSGGPSIDHVIAQQITPAGVAFQSLHLGVRSPWEVCYTGPGSPVNRIEHPNDAVEALFGDFQNPDPAAFERLRAQRRSVLDATKDNIDRVRARVSASDRVRLDEYFERIEEIERRVNATFEIGEQCTPLMPFDLQKSPLRDTDPQVDYFHPYYDPDVASPPLIDSMVMALACDRTRVVTMSWGHQDRFHWLRDSANNVVEANDWHQDVVHKYWSDGGEDLREKLNIVSTYEHTQLAYLLEKLKSVNEGDGTLLDNCLVLYVNEFGDETHVHTGQPYFIAGKCGGAIQTRRWLQYQSVPHNRLFLSLLRAFDLNDTVFGEPEYCAEGPLTGLVG